MRTTAALAVLASTGLLVAGCAGAQSEPENTAHRPPTASAHGAAALPASTLPWNRPEDQQSRVRAAGLSLTPQETLNVHYHAHLDVFVNGTRVPVPAGLGINAGPNGQLPEHGSPGIAPLHTHDESGILHIEAPEKETFTLGQVFQEWGVRLSPDQAGAYSPVRVYVDGRRFAGDPARIVLTPHEEIAVVAGKGTVKVPSGYRFPAGD